jgi:hypothetical protein
MGWQGGRSLMRHKLYVDSAVPQSVEGVVN